MVDITETEGACQACCFWKTEKVFPKKQNFPMASYHGSRPGDAKDITKALIENAAINFTGSTAVGSIVL